jgi:hypothetical protein
MTSVRFNMVCARRRRQRGSSLLELLGVLFVILSLVMGVVGVADFLLLNFRLGRAVDRMVYDQNIKPLTFDLSGAVSLDQNRLRNDMARLIGELENQLLQELDPEESPPYRLEVQIAELQIDPESGKLAALSEPSILRLGRGSMAVTSALEEKASFTERFRELAGNEGDVYPFALPSLSKEGAFVSRSALLGVRVFVSIEESATAGVLQKLGVEGASVAYEVRAVPLRGEVL